MRVLIIIPAFNEEESIVDVVDKVVAAGYDYVVVNDGSTDRTPELCREHGFNFLDLSQNLGIGGAVQAGHCYAKTFGYDVDVQFDGDGQHDINYVPALLKGIEDGADLVVGSRFISDENQFMSSSLRRLGIRWLRWVLKARCGITVTDATSGFRASGKRDRPVLQVLPRRLPRARVDRLGGERGAEDRGGPCRDARASGRGLVHRRPQLGLLHDQGHAGDHPRKPAEQAIRSAST